MQSLNREDLQSRKIELQTSLQQVADEFQRLTGAIQLCDTLIAELDEPEKPELEHE